MRRLARGGWPAVARVAAALAACGCTEELGPVRYNTTRVEGRVTVDGVPLGAGYVEFLPTGRTVGPIRSAPIGPDGRFAADGVPLGTSRVGIAQPRIAVVATRLGPVRITEFDPMQTSIRRTVDAIPLTRVDVDLRDEALTIRRRRLSSP